MIKSYDRNTPAEVIAATLLKEGGVIVQNLADDALMDKVSAELREHFDKNGQEGENDFNGYKTNRVAGILEVSRSSADLLANPVSLGIADAILKRHCVNYQIGSMEGIEIQPGENAQILHRDGDFYPVDIPGVELQIQSMWALTDFTEDNGATRVVLDRDTLKGVKNCEEDKFKAIDESEVSQAVMPKGSVLYWLQSTIHGGGENKASTARAGLFVSYALGWVRQEENHYLTLPREVVDSYPDNIRRLMGYQSHGLFLGVYPDDPDGNWWGS